MKFTEKEFRSGAFTAVGALVFFVLIGVLYPAKPAIVALGVIVGSLSGLVAVGIVLIYRANRIINFAQGSAGGLAAILAASLIVGPKWPYLPAVAVGLVAALVLGALTEIVFIRRLASAPRLVLMVATIGMAQSLDAFSLLLPRLFSYDSIPQPPQPFSFRFSWFPVVFNGGHLLIVIITPLATLGLVAFLRWSRFGMAVRASSESTDRAAMLGIPVKRVNTLVWVLASGLSAVGALLRLPIQGVAIGQPLGPSLLLRALAAAVIGRMESLPRTLVAAIGLGIVDQAVFASTGRTDVVDAVLFAVIVVSLLVNRPKSVDRAAERDASSFAAVGNVRPVPRILAKLPEVRGLLFVATAILGAVLLFLPLSWSESRVSLFSAGLIFAMLALSLVILTGWAGQISLGQVAFAAIGGAVAGRMAQNGTTFFVTIGAAGLVGSGVAVVIGIPALRIRGPFLAVTTLAFGQATGSFFLNDKYLPWLVPDRAAPIPRPVLFGKFDMASEHTTYYVILLFLVFSIAVLFRVRTSRTGRTILAIRDNTRSAQSYGISPIRAQLTAFAISGWIAATAGALFVYQQQRLTQSVLDLGSSLRLFAIAVVGGLASVPGALLGGAYLTFVSYSSFTRNTYAQILASAVGVLAIVLFLPGGLGGAAFSLRDMYLRWVARRRGLHVPSLLADDLVLEVGAEVLPDAAPDVVAPGVDAILIVEQVEVAYGKAQVLFGTTFHVERGEILALLGTNGAGKSTILAAVCGLVKPKGGRILLDGVDITGLSPQAALAAGIVLVPGGKAVFPTLTVAEHLKLAAWIHEKSDPEHVARATELALTTFPILRERIDQRAGNLSGGEQQMLALGQALIAKPKVLMIDELSLGLAPVIVGQLLEIVEKIHQGGTTIVLVEQSINVAASLAQRAVFLEKGTVRFTGPTRELMEKGDILRAVFLGGDNKPHVADRPAAKAARPHGVFEPVCHSCGREHQTVLEVVDLSVRFGGIKAVEGVSFEVRQGEVLGLIGANGAGKTTILDLISGFLEPTAGRVLIGGIDVTALTPEERSLGGLGRSFQDARLFSTLTVRETIATAHERYVPVPDALAAFVLSPAVKLSEQAIDEQVTRLVDLMNLGAYADKFVGELSTGSRRIVDLACVLAHKPTVLLLDEPASGIAQREAEALGPVLLDIRDQTGAGIVVIEHDMPLISEISDELLALETGMQIARGLPAAVLADPRVVAGYLGGSEVAVNRSGSKGAPPPDAPPSRRQPRSAVRT